MVALVCRAWGPPESLNLEAPLADKPGPGEVLVRAEAAALNFADTLFVAGKYQVKPDFPFTPGFEAAGVVEAIGAGVSHFKPGDRVMVALQYGGLSSLVVAPEERVFAISPSLDFQSAAAFPVIYGTSHIGLVTRGNLQSGETLLVLGATSGVGLTAIEIGKAMGATVIAQVRGADKGRVALQAGADHVVDTSTQDLRDTVRALAPSGGVDVVYDPIGGDMAEQALRCVNWGSRMLIVGFAAGRIQQIPANLLLVKSTSATGVFWNSHFTHAPAKMRQSFAELATLQEAGKLKPLVRAAVPVAEYKQAFAMLLDRKEPGKIVLTFA
ncbi:MAG: NADPH:quinone oxidoreductase family protein [Alphaproteobacteria bacterium]|jgi:NADPH2:quinone reductase